MLDKYKLEQPLFCDCMDKIVCNNMISHAYMIETNGVPYAFSLAICMASLFLDKEIDYVNYPEIKIINPVNGVIKKEQILELQSDFSVVPMYGKYLIYIINGAECLNDSSSNTLLKFLEEPSLNVIGILLTSSSDKVLSTIASRCQIFSLYSDDFSVSSVLSEYFDGSCDYEEFVNNYVLMAEDFFFGCEKYGVSFLKNKFIYDNKDKFRVILLLGLYFYYDFFRCFIQKDYISRVNNVKFSSFIMDNNGLNDIIYKINVINNFVNKCRYNVNMDMLIDNFVITFGGNV